MSQKSFPNSRFDSFWYSEEAVCDVPCAVRLGDGLIDVAFHDEGKKLHYIGFEVGEGHFELKCPEIAGRATLHMFPKACELVGSWVEGQTRGMWRIRLGQASMDALLEGRSPTTKRLIKDILR